MEETIPVIDLEKISEELESKKLREACEKWGCFRIVNHSIPLTLLADMRIVVEALHNLPVEIKKNNKEVYAGCGYVASSAFLPLFEALGLYDLASSEAVQNFCSQLNATPHQRFVKRYSKKTINGLICYNNLKGLVEQYFFPKKLNAQKNAFFSYIILPKF